MEHQQKSFSVSREFKANQKKVFNAFASAEAMGQWWGPKGSTITVLAFDFSPGGKFFYHLDSGGQTMRAFFLFKSIQSPESIEFVSSFADEAGNITNSPFPMDFPLEIYNRLTFTENNGVTTVTLEARPLNATAAQETTFFSISKSMEQGYGGTFDQLDAFLLG